MSQEDERPRLLKGEWLTHLRMPGTGGSLSVSSRRSSAEHGRKPARTSPTVDDINPAVPLMTLDYGNYGMFLTKRVHIDYHYGIRSQKP